MVGGCVFFQGQARFDVEIKKPKSKKAAAAPGSGPGASAGEESKGSGRDVPGYELLFWNAATGEPQRTPSLMSDVDWATHSVTVDYRSQGIWPGNGSGVPYRPEADGSQGGTPGMALGKGGSAVDALLYADRFINRTTASRYAAEERNAESGQFPCTERVLLLLHGYMYSVEQAPAIGVLSLLCIATN